MIDSEIEDMGPAYLTRGNPPFVPWRNLPPELPKLSDLLRKAIVESGRSKASIARDALRSDANKINNFLNDRAGINLTTAERIIECLGLEVVLRKPAQPAGEGTGAGGSPLPASRA